MVLLASHLALSASIISLVSAVPAQNDKFLIIPVRKGTSGNPITAKAVVERDISRIASYNVKSGSLTARASSGVAINKDVSYVAGVAICTTIYDLIIDTGSSNTWVC